jgi:ketosteroid isomerase-like protein
MRVVVGMLYLFSGNVVGAGQGPTSPHVKQNLVSIEHEIGRANLNCDYKYFGEVESSDFVFTDANGKVSNKAEDMATAKDCRKSDADYEISDTRVSVYGNTAVVTGRVTTTDKKDAQSAPRRSRFTDVFVWRSGRWQLVAGQSTRISHS